MSKVRISHVYSASAADVWALIGSPASLANWHPAIAASPAEGTRRVCTLADGGEVREEITAHDDAARQYSYRIVSSPLPMTNYRSTLSVSDHDGGAEVVWQSEFEPAGVDAAELEGMIQGLYAAGLDALASKLR